MKALIALALGLALGGVAQAQPVRDGAEGRVAVELAPQTAGVAPGGTVHVALRQQIDKGWHTYWRNAGDSGEPTTIAWTLPAGWRAGEIVWPTPSRQKASETILNYGYSDEVYLPVPIQVPATARPGETVTLRAAARWLVCEEICIPGGRRAAGQPAGGRGHADAASEVRARGRRHAGGRAQAGRVDGRIYARGRGDQAGGRRDRRWRARTSPGLLLPLRRRGRDPRRAPGGGAGANGLTLTIEPGFGFQAPQPPTKLAGVLALAGGAAFEVEAVAGRSRPEPRA
jgi:thiol:disulfide interchange protein DsbD